MGALSLMCTTCLQLASSHKTVYSTTRASMPSQGTYYLSISGVGYGAKNSAGE